MYQKSIVRRQTHFYEEPENRNHTQCDGTGYHDNRTFKNANLQEIFLNNCRKNENLVHVDTIKGDRHTGKIIGFDSQSVILCYEDSQILLYKSAVSVITPVQAVQYIFNESNKREYYQGEPYGDAIPHVSAKRSQQYG